MKIFVISLQKRSDRREFFIKTNKNINYQIIDAVDGSKISNSWLASNGFDVNKKWLDPIERTRLFHGEVGCFISHWKLWEECSKSDEPFIILEDDAIITDNFSIDELYKQLEKGYNFIYLGWKEMAQSRPIDDKFVVPNYPYWTVGYVLTPQAAATLLDDKAKQNIIPADEYLSLKMKELNPCAYGEFQHVVRQRSREECGTDVDGGLGGYEFEEDVLTMEKLWDDVPVWKIDIPYQIQQEIDEWISESRAIKDSPLRELKAHQNVGYKGVPFRDGVVDGIDHNTYQCSVSTHLIEKSFWMAWVLRLTAKYFGNLETGRDTRNFRLRKWDGHFDGYDIWTNFSYKGDDNPVHNHAGFVAGVMYYQNHGHPTIFNEYDCGYRGDNGTMLMWPADAQHYVVEQTSDDERITLAFNVGVRTPDETPM